MEKEILMRLATAISLALIIDFYVFIGLLFVAKKYKRRHRRILFVSYWFVPIAFLIFSLFYAKHIATLQPEYVQFRAVFIISGIYFSIYIPKLILCLFLLVQHLAQIVCLAATKLIHLKCSVNCYFFEKAILFKAGILFSFLIFLSLIYGINYGKYDYTIETATVKSNKLPLKFNGFKIIHISDAHLGSFADTSKLSKAIDIINSQEADIIAFTGDLVNVESKESLDFIPIFKRLTAKYGKFAVLGNHDMGDYRKWDSEKDKQKNLSLIDSFYRATNFKLLNNESSYIKISNDSIAILGIKNWGKPPFKQYGKLSEAQIGTNDSTFQILLSHDPSHWDAEVLPFTNIDLTLSGHTHGMQIGFNNKLIKWSPASFLYPRWNGLYQQSNQFLYVNRGIGFIGFPGRTGMWPEITLLILEK